MKHCDVCKKEVTHPYLVKVVSVYRSVFYHKECYAKEAHDDPTKYQPSPPLVATGRNLDSG